MNRGTESQGNMFLLENKKIEKKKEDLKKKEEESKSTKLREGRIQGLLTSLDKRMDSNLKEQANIMEKGLDNIAKVLEKFIVKEKKDEVIEDVEVVNIIDQAPTAPKIDINAPTLDLIDRIVRLEKRMEIVEKENKDLKRKIEEKKSTKDTKPNPMKETPPLKPPSWADMIRDEAGNAIEKDQTFKNDWIDVCNAKVKKVKGQRKELSASMNEVIMKRKEEEEKKEKKENKKKESPKITLEEKNRKIEETMDICNRTQGIKIGNKTMVKKVIKHFQEQGRFADKMPEETKKKVAMKFLTNKFAQDSLKFDKEEWNSIKIKELTLKEKEDSDIIYMEFEEFNDVMKFNSKLSNLDKADNEKIVPYITPEAWARHAAFKNMEWEIRQKKKGSKTKVRPGRYDFKLLVKEKEDPTPWSKVSPIFPPANYLPDFDVGELTDQGKEEEKAAIRAKNEKIENKKKKMEAENNLELDDDLMNQINMQEYFNDAPKRTSSLLSSVGTDKKMRKVEEESQETDQEDEEEEYSFKDVGEASNPDDEIEEENNERTEDMMEDITNLS